MPSEQDQFLSDLPGEDGKNDLFEQPLVPEKGEGSGDPDPEKVPDSIKDRQHKRLQARLTAEREANIALNARVQALSEAQQFRKDTGQVNPDLKPLFADTDEGKQGAERLQSILEKTKADAKAEALEEFQRQQEAASREVQNQEQVLDDMLEEIEDEYDVDLTSGTPQSERLKKDFYTLLGKLSPKDADGNVKDFADPIATWEALQEKSKQSKSQETNRAKDLGSRSMVRSGSSSGSQIEANANERFLRDAGII